MAIVDFDRYHKLSMLASDGRDMRLDLVFSKDGIITDASPVHKPKIAICGPGRCGKDIASRWFNTFTILRFVMSTSELAAEYMFNTMNDLGHTYSDPLACWQDRSNHRRLWGQMIDKLNEKKGCELYLAGTEKTNDQDIWNGIRRKRELRACKRHGLFQTSIWIERLMVPTDPTIDYGPEECDMAVTNNTTPQDFFVKLDNIATLMGVKLRAPDPRAVELFNAAY